MSERPILFSAPMVRAILDGRKTQTRRPARIDAATAGALDSRSGWSWTFGADGFGGAHQLVDGGTFSVPVPRSMLGAAGDRLWVRESWRYHDWTGDGLPWVQYAADDARRLCERIPAEWGDRVEGEWATLSDPLNIAIDGAARDRRWRPSIHMPRWASRLTLDVTAVRVERLRSITASDAVDEGATALLETGHPLRSQVYERFGTWTGDDAQDVDGPFAGAVAAFATLWDSINGNRASWASNPWVWVIEFKRVEAGQ